jgi:hypothetical protein
MIGEALRDGHAQSLGARALRHGLDDAVKELADVRFLGEKRGAKLALDDLLSGGARGRACGDNVDALRRARGGRGHESRRSGR